MPDGHFVDGRLAVIRDTGRRVLPRTPATLRIEPDGRTWNVGYHGALPTIQITPSTGAERLHIHDDQRRQVHAIDIRRMSLITLPKLGDGTYKLTFTHGGLTTGKLTTLSIAFDQTAPQIYLEAPLDDASVTQPIDVKGSTLPGWTVSFEASAIPSDAQHRFMARVLLRPGFKSLAVRFEHPQRGTHYYVRRLR